MFSKNVSVLLTVLLFLISTVSYLVEDKLGLMVSLAAVWIVGLSYSLKRLEKRIVLFAFYITIFTFLMARLFIDDFASGYKSDYTEEAQSVLHYSHLAGYFIYYVITLSLVFVFLGYVVCNKGKRANEIECSIGRSAYSQAVKVISKRLSYVLYIFTVFTTLEMVFYIWANGYMAFYLSFEPSLPHIFYTFDAAFGFAFFLFLACMPEKKEATPLIVLYLLRACIALMSGQRNGFILPVLFIIIYFYLRNSITPNNQWIGRRGQMLLIVTFPFLCASMFIIMLIRGDNNLGNEGLITYFIDFFYQLGGSVKVLGYSYDLQACVPDGQNYVFGPLIRWVDSNFVSQLLGLGHHYENASVDMALHGHSLGSFLTYNVDQYRYLHGGNLASSYIAELWLNYGFVGVAIGSLIYGRIMASVLFFARKNIWKATIAFIMMYNIIYAPRASYLYFVTECMSYSFIAIVIYVYFRTRNIPKINYK